MTHFNQINQRSTHFFKFCLLAALMLFSFFLNAQKKFSLEVNYGLNGNFFVRSYPENAPWPLLEFNKKDFIGTIGGIEGRYVLNSKSSIGLGFSKSHNQKKINYYNGYNASMRDFNITHTNYFYAIDYERSLSKKIKSNVKSAVKFISNFENVCTELAIENKFDYVQNATYGYTNNGIYILYYDTDLTIKEAL